MSRSILLSGLHADPFLPEGLYKSARRIPYARLETRTGGAAGASRVRAARHRVFDGDAISTSRWNTRRRERTISSSASRRPTRAGRRALHLCRRLVPNTWSWTTAPRAPHRSSGRPRGTSRRSTRCSRMLPLSFEGTPELLFTTMIRTHTGSSGARMARFVKTRSTSISSRRKDAVNAAQTGPRRRALRAPASGGARP